MRLSPLAIVLLSISLLVLTASGTLVSGVPTHPKPSHEVSKPSQWSDDYPFFYALPLLRRASWLDGIKRKLKRKMKLCVSCNTAAPSPERSPPRPTLSRAISLENFRLHERFRAQAVGGDERHLPGRVDVSSIGVSGCQHGPTCAHVYGLEPHPPAGGGANAVQPP